MEDVRGEDSRDIPTNKVSKSYDDPRSKDGISSSE